jgi:hypothetical protein
MRACFVFSRNARPTLDELVNESLRKDIELIQAGS